MRYEGSMLIVRDVQRSKEFYRDVLQAAVELDLPGHVVFEGGFFLLQENDWLSFSGLDRDSVRYGPLSHELVFETDDIVAFAKRLESKQGILWIHGIKEHPWGRRAIRFFDPDRHVIEVGESMRVVVSRFLRQGMTVEEAAAKSEFPVSFALSCKAELEAEESGVDTAQI
jgi:catechol 2,3-dioxygenase-like lactoylglutathione lyase family enzyme